ncbi:MAG: hypothetical protein ACSLE0_06680 [Chitinophagaceae bacterium]
MTTKKDKPTSEKENENSRHPQQGSNTVNNYSTDSKKMYPGLDASRQCVTDLDEGELMQSHAR